METSESLLMIVDSMKEVSSSSSSLSLTCCKRFVVYAWLARKCARCCSEPGGIETAVIPIVVGVSTCANPSVVFSECVTIRDELVILASNRRIIDSSVSVSSFLLLLQQDFTAEYGTRWIAPRIIPFTELNVNAVTQDVYMVELMYVEFNAPSQISNRTVFVRKKKAKKKIRNKKFHSTGPVK